MRTRRRPPCADKSAAPLSLWDRVALGVDHRGAPVHVALATRNMLIGGIPGAGKSNGIAQILGHAALCDDVEVWLFDGKETELAAWEPLAHRSVGFDCVDALDAISELQARLDSRLTELRAAGLRKVHRGWGRHLVLVVIDELALYTVTYGEPAQQRRFVAGVRDLVQRGRAAGLSVVTATQRPSADVVPPSLRDLFAYRWALACANPVSSDVILGDNYANVGYDASEINPEDAGVGHLLTEDRRAPTTLLANYLDDDDIRYLVRVGVQLRGVGSGA